MFVLMPTEWTPEEWANRIRSYMDQNDISKKQLSNELEVSLATVYRWVSGAHCPQGYSAIILVVRLVPEELQKLLEMKLGEVRDVKRVRVDSLVRRALPYFENKRGCDGKEDV